jgi:chemotaxis protein CheX
VSALKEAPVSEDEVLQICQEVWSAFLGEAELYVAGDGPDVDGALVTGCVSIAGEWSGSLVLECSHDLADAAASALFAADPGTLSPGEVSDAIGELTNMVGGAVKGMVPAPSRLSIPSVSSGTGLSITVPGAARLLSIAFVWDGHPARVTLWELS